MRRHRLNFFLAIIILVMPKPALAQARIQASSFEVASLRLVESETPGYTSISSFDSNHFTATKASLLLLICIAYGIDENQLVSPPSWLAGTYYNVAAKAEGEAPLDYQQMKPLLQHLLEQRLHLEAHRGTRQVAGYALVISKTPPILKPAITTNTQAYIMTNQLSARSTSLETFAAMLTHPLGKPVKDETGIPGTFNITLDFAPVDSTDSTLPSIFTAIQQQLGLKLEPRQIQQQTLKIDRVERVPAEN